MHLYWFVVLGIPVTCATVVLQSYANIANSASEHIIVEKRARRSLSGIVQFGRLARKELLYGTKKITNYITKGHNGAKQYRYTKPGGWTQAQRDFYAVKPTNVARGSTGQVHLGTIGDRKIELKHNGAFDLPTIKIFTVRLGGAEPQLITEEIVYINRPT